MVRKYFTDDHKRLDGLLNTAFISAEEIDKNAYAEFRTGLLKHIAQEEKILIPALNKTEKYSLAEKLRLEHGALAALLVLPPSADIRNALRGILKPHNEREEADQGLYHDCEVTLSMPMATIMQMVTSYPDVPVMPYNNTQYAFDAARRAVSRAGYDFDRLIKQEN